MGGDRNDEPDRGRGPAYVKSTTARQARRRTTVMGGVFPGVQGATVLHCLAGLYEMAIQGAT
jgi:hypothetical protein